MIATASISHSQVVLALLVGSLAFGQGRAQAQVGRAEQARDLRVKIDGLLRDELTRCWYPRSLDQGEGGFHQEFGPDWSPRPDPNRFLVYQSRMTWTAAAFALHSPEHREEFAGYARKGVEYLDRVMRDGQQGGFHWVLNVKGEVDPGLGVEKHVYGTAFALYASSKAYEATHDAVSLKVARDAFDWLERHAHDPEHGGYFEALTREGKPITSWDRAAPVERRTDRLGIYYGFKTMNSHIHLLEAIAEFYRVEPTPAVRGRLEEMLVVVRDRVAAEPGGLNLYLSREWKAAPAHDSFGHDVETAFLLVEAAEVLGRPEDEATWRVARSLVDHALDWGWDARHGGFYDKGDSFGTPAYDTTKVWWTQAEGLNALLLMDRKFAAETPRYWDAFLKQWEFIDRHLIDHARGGWYWETRADGSPLGEPRKANQWKANYHTGRAMMGASAMLRAVEARGR